MYKIIMKRILYQLMLCSLIFMCFSTVEVSAAGESLFVRGAGGGDCSQASPCQIQEALDAAADGDLVYLAGGTYTGSSNPLVTIDNSISMLGGWNGSPSGLPVLDPAISAVTLDGEDVRQVMAIKGPATVLLDGFTITGGYITSSNEVEKGAGIHALDTHLTMNQMVIDSNRIDISDVDDSYAYGGGVMLDAGSLQIADSVSKNNSATAKTTGMGGALALLDMLQAVEVINSVFDKNDSWTASAIHFSAAIDYISFPVLTIYNSRFIDNGRGLSGGGGRGGYAGAISLSRAEAYIEKNEFINNYASNNYGAIHAVYSNLSLQRNLFTGNRGGEPALWI